MSVPCVGLEWVIVYVTAASAGSLQLKAYM